MASIFKYNFKFLLYYLKLYLLSDIPAKYLYFIITKTKAIEKKTLRKLLAFVVKIAIDFVNVIT